ANDGVSRENVPLSHGFGQHSSELSTSPSYMSRRESVTGFATSAPGAEFSHGMYGAVQVRGSDAAGGMFGPSQITAASQRRPRRESVGSSISETASVDKGVDRKYVCDWPECAQAFDRVEHLNRHKRRHTGEKPYRCLISKCTKLFSRFDNMMQHVGIHCVDGAKTEIPNIKNLNSRCNGRGRVRRTSYRGTQDSYEKFRRHVESSLGPNLAECCILPTKNPDFSNLTLRPLLNDNMPATISEDTPLCESVVASGMVPQNANYKRPRCDSVVDGMDKHFPSGPSSEVTAAPTSSPAKKHAKLTESSRILPGSSSFIIGQHNVDSAGVSNGMYDRNYKFPRQGQEHR
ncbi:Up in starvation, partial [Coemansia sp. RSA 485]